MVLSINVKTKFNIIHQWSLNHIQQPTVSNPTCWERLKVHIPQTANQVVDEEEDARFLNDISPLQWSKDGTMIRHTSTSWTWMMKVNYISISLYILIAVDEKVSMQQHAKLLQNFCNSQHRSIMSRFAHVSDSKAVGIT